MMTKMFCFRALLGFFFFGLSMPSYSSLTLGNLDKSVDGSGLGKIQSRIVGGTAVSDENDYPFIASVKFLGRSGFIHGCGGSLISPDTILSAAHCFVGVPPQNIRIVIGTKRQSQLGKAEVKEVSEILIHPNYLVNQVGDIALLKLSTPSAAPPVILSTRTLEQGAVASAKTLRVIGWGLLQQNATSIPDELMQVDVPLIPNDVCSLSYPGAPDIVANLAICAGVPQGGIDSCQGDSGGPLFLIENDSLVQAGVVSWGAGCALAGRPGVYASVAAFQDWITDNGQGEFVDNSSSLKMGFAIPGKPFTKSTQIVNNSTEVITLLGVEKVSDLNSTFLVNDSACQNEVLLPGNSCDIVVTANQVSQGSFTASLKANLVGDSDPVGLTKASIDIFSTIMAGPDLDIAGLQWYTGGDIVWRSVVDATAVGQSALSIGNIDNSQLSVLATTITGPNTLNYRAKLQSETDFDVLKVLVGEQVVERLSGNTLGWVEKSLFIPAGNHLVTFAYQKDLTDVSLLSTDMVRLDNFRLANAVLVPETAQTASTPPNTFDIVPPVASTSAPGLFGSDNLVVASEQPGSMDGIAGVIEVLMNIIRTLMGLVTNLR